MRRTFLHRAANGGCSASKASSGSSGFASRKFGCAASVPSPSCSAPFPVRIPARSSAFPSFANVPQLSAFASSRNAEPTSARVGADSLPGSSPRSSEGVSSAGPTGESSFSLLNVATTASITPLNEALLRSLFYANLIEDS